MLFFFQAEDGIRDYDVTGVQTCALPILYIVYSIGKEECGLTTVPVKSLSLKQPFEL